MTRCKEGARTLYGRKVSLEHVFCDLCNSNQYKIRYTKPDNWLWINEYEYPIVECKKCGLVYVNPRPSQESMTIFYPDNYHSNRGSIQHKNRYKKQMKFLPKLTTEKILDIGCAQGDFLIYLKKVYSEIQIYGCDYFSQNVNSKDINFTQELLTNCNYKEEEFDLVTAWAVFEHLHTPSDYMKEVARILKKKGKFIFLVTNAESLYGKRAYKEDVPRHLYHFSESTLKKYAVQYGFRMNRCIYTDEIFDGRGYGTFLYGIGKLLGIKWQQYRDRKFNRVQAIGIKIGEYIDKKVFSKHWEAKVRKNGIIIVEFEKK